MKASILTIGDELLNGQTVDTNASWIGRSLNDIGITVTLKASVGDDRVSIIKGLDYAYDNSSLVIVTGGLGPTHDDITKKVLAEYFNDHLVFHQETYDKIMRYFDRIGKTSTDAHRIQSYMPSRAVLIDNNHGTAPGMWMQEGERALISMPGVPSEMKGIMEDGGLVKIAAMNPNQHIRHFIIQTAGIGETRIAETISDIIDSFPSEINLAYLPGLGTVKVRLTAIGQDPLRLDNSIHHFGQLIQETLGSHVFAIGDISLEEVIASLANKKQLTIGTAESCTGGSIARALTARSGSSSFFKGAVVAYSNELKMNQLGVNGATLETQGAVSEQTVIEMVKGLINQLNVDIAVSVSGIAGPTGGTPEKPVGTIWTAVGSKESVVTQKLQLVKNRQLNIDYTVTSVLNQLRLFLEEQSSS